MFLQLMFLKHLFLVSIDFAVLFHLRLYLHLYQPIHHRLILFQLHLHLLKLDCNLILVDEGEVETESICDVWVDTDGDTILDGTEPQSQYSQETNASGTLIVGTSVNVPGSHPT